MRISIGSDHSALDLKNELCEYLESKGYQVIDRGTNSYESCDYTDIGYCVAKDVYNNTADRGIVICTTGIGMSIIANKVHGVRCALVYNEDAALLTRLHNDSNCLALGAKYTSIEVAKKIVDIWLTTDFSNKDRHIRRIDKIKKYEQGE